MSRIGNKIIELPAKVTLSLDGETVTVKGPKGELTQQIDSDFEVKQEGTTVQIVRPTEQKRHRALHGTYRALINNMVIGVSEGYERKLELVGVGFKAAVSGQILEMNLGYSHNIFMAVPGEIKVSAETAKGKPPVVILQGNDKQLIGQVAAKIKSLRKVEPYKGKGVKFVGEQIRRKAGKTASK